MIRVKTKNPYYQGPGSDHFDGTRFFQPQSIECAKGLADILKWQLSGKKKKWPRRIGNTCHDCPRPRVANGEVSVTFIGHATVLLQICGLNILTDPFFADRASPVSFAGPKRVRAPGLAIDELPQIDVVLLTHNHFDHLDTRALDELQNRFDPTIITPLGNGAIITASGKRHRITEADWADTVQLSNDMSVTLTPALHWSKRNLNDRNMALWCAFVLHTPSGTIYFAGDTGYGNGQHFRAIREEYGPSRLSLLPIGAYEPRWFMKAQHMNPDEAVKAHIDLESRQSIAIHHGTIQLTDEPIDAPVKDLDLALRKYAIDPDRFRVLDCGQSMGC